MLIFAIQCNEKHFLMESVGGSEQKFKMADFLLGVRHDADYL